MAHGAGNRSGLINARHQDTFTLRWVDQASRNKIPLHREGPLVNQIIVPRDQRVLTHHRVKASSLKSCLRVGGTQSRSHKSAP